MMTPTETPPVHLREHTMADLMPLHALLSDPAVTWTLPGMYRETPEDTESYLRSVIADARTCPRMRYNLAIADACNICIGEIGLHFIDGTMTDGCWGLGYYLRPDLWNRGCTTLAVRQALRFIFCRGASRVSASCLAENTASRCVLWNCGFTREGMLKAHTWHDGQWKDCAVYRLLRSEWEAQTSGEAAP